MNVSIPRCTVGYLVRRTTTGEEAFFGKKITNPKTLRRRIAGQWLGFGGDIEPDDPAIPESFARELAEETDLGCIVSPADTTITANVLIRDERGDRLRLFYLLAYSWLGMPTHGKEFEQFGWFPTDRLPEHIPPIDRLVLPRIFAGERLTGYVEYDKDGSIVKYSLLNVDVVPLD